MNIPVFPERTFSDDLWAEPVAMVVEKPRATKKPRAKKAKQTFSTCNQVTNSIAAAQGINVFATVVHPLTYQRMTFYAASNDLQNTYHWNSCRVQTWAKRAKHQM